MVCVTLVTELWSGPCEQVGVPEVVDAVKGADILVFVLPHQFIGKLCDQIKSHVKPGVIGISLIKVSVCVCVCVLV